MGCCMGEVREVRGWIQWDGMEYAFPNPSGGLCEEGSCKRATSDFPTAAGPAIAMLLSSESASKRPRMPTLPGCRQDAIPRTPLASHKHEATQQPWALRWQPGLHACPPQSCPPSTLRMGDVAWADLLPSPSPPPWRAWLLRRPATRGCCTRSTHRPYCSRCLGSASATSLMLPEQALASHDGVQPAYKDKRAASPIPPSSLILFITTSP